MGILKDFYNNTIAASLYIIISGKDNIYIITKIIFN